MYPSKFHIVHKLFSGNGFPKPVWGDISDGPLEWPRDVIECIVDAFRDEAPTIDTLRVWFFDGVRMHDMTHSFLEAYHKRMEQVA
jgi:hypothetical protein